MSDGTLTAQDWFGIEISLAVFVAFVALVGVVIWLIVRKK